MKMGILTANIRDVISFKLKERYDGVTDHFSRIFMPKLFILCSLVMGINFFNDKVHCIVSKKTDLSTDFVQSTCWITGFYIYEEMHGRIYESAYYGIPENLDHDGIDELGELCALDDRTKRQNPNCFPMTKRYFLQYQWISFYVASLALMYYMPYIIFQIVNVDIISLHDAIEEEKLNAEQITQNFFNYRVNSKISMRFRLFLNILIKLIYVMVNLGGLFITDRVLGGRFLHYGLLWCKWHMLPNSLAYDISLRNDPKPGNYLLPSWGVCDIHEAMRDVRSTVVNRHKFVCEISPNVIHQYILIILWFFFNFGIIISTFGLTCHLINHVKTILCIFKPGFKEGTLTGELYLMLTFREIEYLEYIRNKNIPAYGEIMRKLTKTRHEMFPLKRFFDNEISSMALL